MASPSARPTRRVLSTWPVLLAALAVALLAATGILGPVNQALRAAVAPITRQAALAEPPILVEVDTVTLQQLGPPPWSAAVWQQVDERLRAASVRGIVVDPADRLITPSSATFSNLWSPTLVTASGTVAPSAFPDDSTTLHLPRSGGVLRGLPKSRSSQDFLCIHARCPSGEPLADRAHIIDTIPRVSLGALMGGGVLLDANPGDIVIIGLTEPTWARTLPIGPSGTVVSWPEAVALSVATAGSQTAMPTVSALLVYPALLLLVLLTAGIAHAERGLSVDAWMFVLPLGTALLVLGLGALGVVYLPPAEFALAAFAGPLAEVLRVRWQTIHFLRGASLRIARADLSTGWGESLRNDPQALLAQLASLTWNHFPTDRMAYLHDRGRRQGFELVGGYGLDKSDVRESDLKRSNLVAMARSGRCDTLFQRAELRGHVLPIHHNGTVLGYWIVGWQEDEAEPDVQVLVDLIHWVERALEPSERANASLFGSWLQVDAELESIERSLQRSATSREWQLKVIRHMGLPLATADRAGTFVFQNEAFRKLFDDPPGSVRGLTWSVRGEEGLSEVMRRLFVDRAELDVQLESGTVLRIAAIGTERLEGIAVYAAPGLGSSGRAPSPGVQQKRKPARPILEVVRLRKKTIAPGSTT